MSWIWARTCSRSGSTSITGGSWATSARTWPGWAVTSASPTTAPPLLPNTSAGPLPSAASSRHVMGLLLGSHLLIAVLAAAVADATRIVGHEGIAADERVGKPGEAGAVHRRADHQQRGATAPPLVIELCAGH